MFILIIFSLIIHYCKWIKLVFFFTARRIIIIVRILFTIMENLNFSFFWALDILNPLAVRTPLGKFEIVHNSL